jgi:signal transduction histidine kinase
MPKRSPTMWYAAGVGAVTAATVMTFVLRGLIGSSISLLFFPAVILTAVYGGYGPALLATVLSAASLAFFFITPIFSFEIGSDDLIRLTVFAAVGIATASISSARRRAEAARQSALEELQAAFSTLRKVSGWPVFVDAQLAAGARKVLEHAASVVGCARATAVWEADDEPWIFEAASTGDPDVVARHAPVHRESLVREPFEAPTHYDKALGSASAGFALEHLHGRVSFTGIPGSAADIVPLAEIVAREVGNSLEQLYLHDRLQQIAIREDRIRLARDLHDGVLQSLTGIRLQLQALADEHGAPSSISDRVLAVERAIAIEQRELRMFIEDLKPIGSRRLVGTGLEAMLEDVRSRLETEWQTPVVVRVSPPGLAVGAPVEQTLRLTIREAAINALKHAHPSRVTVDLQPHGIDALRVVVSDDGRGFPFRGRLEHDALVSSNAGPLSLRERVAGAGGTLAVESSPNGSRVEIVLPAIIIKSSREIGTSLPEKAGR